MHFNINGMAESLSNVSFDNRRLFKKSFSFGLNSNNIYFATVFQSYRISLSVQIFQKQ